MKIQVAQHTVSLEVALSWFIKSGTVALRIKRVVRTMDAHLKQWSNKVMLFPFNAHVPPNLCLNVKIQIIGELNPRICIMNGNNPRINLLAQSQKPWILSKLWNVIKGVEMPIQTLFTMNKMRFHLKWHSVF